MKQKKLPIKENGSLDKVYAQFVKKNPSPVLQIDNEGNVLICNSSAKKFLGKDIEQKKIFEMFQNLKQEQLKNLKQDTVLQIENQIKNQIFLFTFQKDKSTKTTFLYGSNITELKKIEEEHAKKIEELEEFHELVSGREERMIELKKEVNILCKELKKPLKYTFANIKKQESRK